MVESPHPAVGDVVLGGRYELLQQVKGSVGGTIVILGTKGWCRFCETASSFQKRAHTFPEALGNKWVFSADECDSCNEKFSLYEDALISCVGALLTLGGTKGKGNKVRQTGRTSGDSVIGRRPGSERPQIFMTSRGRNWDDRLSIDPVTGLIRLAHPIPPVQFKPRHAYKALVKMAVALMPADELANYNQLRSWLLDVNDSAVLSDLEVAISFGSLGNAPPLVCGTLLRRRDCADMAPHILFILCAGSVCLQISLTSDRMDDHLPPFQPGTIKIKWANVIAGGPGQSVRIAYSDPFHLNWSSGALEPQPFESLILDFNPTTCEGVFTPVFRNVVSPRS